MEPRAASSSSVTSSEGEATDSSSRKRGRAKSNPTWSHVDELSREENGVKIIYGLRCKAPGCGTEFQVSSTILV